MSSGAQPAIQPKSLPKVALALAMKRPAISQILRRFSKEARELIRACQAKESCRPRGSDIEELVEQVGFIP